MSPRGPCVRALQYDSCGGYKAPEDLVSATTAAEVYDEHIRALPAEQRLHLLALIAGGLAVEGPPSSEDNRYNLADLYGIGQGVWQGLEPQEYVNRLREAPDDRPQ